MKIQDLIGPTAVFVGIRADDKREVLEALSERAAALAGLDPQPVLEALWRREELGSTALSDHMVMRDARAGSVGRAAAQRPVEALDLERDRPAAREGSGSPARGTRATPSPWLCCSSQPINRLGG